jgi:crescentin
MSSVWEKLFGNSPAPANDSRDVAIRYPSERELPQTKRTSAIASLGALAGGGQGRAGEATPKSLRVARTFDSIGRRNESLRAQLDAVEFSFRNIETIRSQFYDVLTPIDQTLVEIERTKVAHLEAERKLEAVTDAHERLKGDHASLILEHNALAGKQDELSARASDLEKAVAAAESASSEARAALADRSAKLERTERELEDNRRRLHTVSAQLPALRAEFAAKEKRLQEVEQQRANLQDQHNLSAQENHSLRKRIEEFVAIGSKLSRQLSELESRRDDLAGRVEELEAALNQETTAHAKLKSAHLDAAEAHRLTASQLREELSAMNARSEAAERLLAEARSDLRERDAAIRGFEQRALESSLATKSKEAALIDLERDLASVRASHGEVEAARAALDQRAAELAKALESKDAALQRAEQKVETLETRMAEQSKAMNGERVAFEERLAKLNEQLEAEQSARAFTEGALQTARQERGARRQDPDSAGASAPKDPPPTPVETARDKITRLRG